MLHTAFAKGAAPDVPATDAAGKNHLHGMRASAVFSIQARGQSEFIAGPAEQAPGRLGQQLLTCPVHQPQTLITIESKNRYVNLTHHGAQKRGSFKSAHSLLAQCLSE